MSSGFRFVVTKRDTTKVKAYGLAVAVQMVLLPLVLGTIGAHPTFPAFYPLGAVAGGLLFGASMSLAGGCAAGVWYKVGGGSLDAVAAVLGMIAGGVATEIGPLAGIRAALQSVGASNIGPADLGVLLPALSIPLGLLLAFLLLRTRISSAGDWTWRRTGLLIGLTGLIAWPLSTWAMRGFGMAVLPGTVGLVSRPLAIGYDVSLWDLFFVLGLPAGAYVAARSHAAVKIGFTSWRALSRRFVGGIGLGAGASLAAGCTVGHGLTGLPLLAPGSVVTMLAIFAGSVAVPVLEFLRRPSTQSATREWI